jgi:hypothetical protein
MMFRAVFWVILPCRMIVDNHFTRQYNPEDNSEHHTRRRENLKSHIVNKVCAITEKKVKQSCYTPWRRLGGEEV